MQSPLRTFEPAHPDHFTLRMRWMLATVLLMGHVQPHTGTTPVGPAAQRPQSCPIMPTPAPTPPPTASGTCSFETGATGPWCGVWSNAKTGDSHDWRRGKGQTNTPATGPSGAAAGKGYLYIEANPWRWKNKAILESIPLFIAPDKSLSFFYHIYGDDVDELQVLVGQTLIFRASGNQGDAWKNEIIDLSPYSGPAEVIQFIGYCRNGERGDISIDEIGFSSTAPTPAPMPAPTPAPQPGPPASGTCSFETGAKGPWCGVWSNAETGDSHDWRRGKGQTKTPATGPSGAAAGKGYLYIEANPWQKKNKSVLQSIPLFIAPGKSLSFFYHMYGDDVDELQVLVGQTLIFSASGNQGDAWKHETIDLSPYSGPAEVVQFVGYCRRGDLGDIAVDEIGFV